MFSRHFLGYMLQLDVIFISLFLKSNPTPDYFMCWYYQRSNYSLWLKCLQKYRSCYLKLIIVVVYFWRWPLDVFNDNKRTFGIKTTPRSRIDYQFWQIGKNTFFVLRGDLRKERTFAGLLSRYKLSKFLQQILSLSEYWTWW